MQAKCQAPCARGLGKKRGIDNFDEEENGNGIVDHRGNGDMDMSSELLISEVSRVLSGDEALTLREPMPGRLKAIPNFARAPDHAPCTYTAHA